MNNIRIGIIGGTGGMGRWFADFFIGQDYLVQVCGKHTAVKPVELAGQCDVVVVSVPIGITCDMIEQIGPCLRKEALLMDLTSLKAEPVKAMLQYSSAEVIGCHPLFGPQVETLAGQHVVLCPARAERWLPWLRSVLGEAGALLVEATPAEHDQRMALVQGLNHLNSLTLGMVLSDAGASLADLASFSTPGFQEKLKIVEKVLRPNPRLYAEIITLNPDIGQIVDCYERALSELKTLIGKKDTGEVIALMEHHAARLWPTR
jgi:prephenate dehydrogenase